MQAKTFTVYQNPNPTSKNEFIFVGERFAWFALFFPIIVPLIKGFWITSISLSLLLFLGTIILKSFNNENIYLIFFWVAVQIVYCFEYSDLYHFEILRKGWKMITTIQEKNIVTAEKKFFEIYVSEKK